MSNHIGHFSLWGDFQPEKITDLLGLEPSMIMRKGDVLEGASRPATASTWDIHCPSDCENAQQQVNALLNILSPKAELLKPLVSKYHAELNIVSDSSVVNLDRQTLQKIAALDLSLNCFYLCDEDKNGN